MSMVQLQRLGEPLGPGEEYGVAPDKLLAGNPRQAAWTQYTDAGGRFFAGTWRSTPGKWTIRYTEEEYCEILSGVSIITAADGAAMRVQAGDRFVIPRGFAGSWEVVETTTKHFVIFEPGA